MRWSNACRTLACIGIWALLEDCGSSRPPSEHAFFPLAAGSYWQYRIERTTMDGVSELRYAIYTVSPDVGTGQGTAIRETMDGRRYYYALNADGVYRIGERPRRGGAVTYHQEKRLVLPHAPALAQRWRSTTTTSVLESTGPPWETLFRINVPVEVEYRIESLSETVQTPAGRFTGCLLVSGRGTTNTDVGNTIGRTDIEVTSKEWFAPHIGLVRLERTERSTSDALNYGALRMELDRWWSQ